MIEVGIGDLIFSLVGVAFVGGVATEMWLHPEKMFDDGFSIQGFIKEIVQFFKDAKEEFKELWQH